MLFEIPESRKENSVDQGNVLTVLGCSGSLALAVMFASPASTNSTIQADADQLKAEAPAMLAAQSQGNRILDALGCSCAACQMSGQQTLI